MYVLGVGLNLWDALRISEDDWFMKKARSFLLFLSFSISLNFEYAIGNEFFFLLLKLMCSTALFPFSNVKSDVLDASIQEKNINEGSIHGSSIKKSGSVC